MSDTDNLLTLDAWVNGLEGTAVFDDVQYVFGCRDCVEAWTYQRDSKTVKTARAGDAKCPNCGATLDMIRDAKADDETP